MQDPGADCFDAGDSAMDRLQAFLEGGEDEAARGHLLACSRCRFIYCSLRAAV